jgi:hypothetical protein
VAGDGSSPGREQMGERRAEVGRLAVEDKEGAPWGRLELVSDKIQSGDSKRKVMHIRFGCPTKKNGFG